MPNYCLETTNLSHHWNARTPVLKDINLRVPKDSIYGFLGPNGAGKTTTLKLILGLLQKQQGEILVFGQNWEAHRIEILHRIGSLIECPSLYAQLTAGENLRVLQRVYRCPKSRIDQVLALTGLTDTGSKKAGKFSFGMKQRLAIAIALLNDPTLLILDEPTNGLDPEGIIEMRELLKTLNKRGVTILLSSHLLGEMEKLITHTGIIHKGQLLFQGTLVELRHTHSDPDLETIFINLTKKRPCKAITYTVLEADHRLKKKRSAASFLTIAGSMLIPLLIIIARMDSASGLAIANRRPQIWENLYDRNWLLMGSLLLPMGIVLAASLVTQLEYRNNTWKQLFTTPQTLTTIFLAKLSVLLVMLIEFFLLFNLGIWLTGVVPGLFLGVSYPPEPFPWKTVWSTNARFFLDSLAHPCLAIRDKPADQKFPGPAWRGTGRLCCLDDRRPLEIRLYDTLHLLRL